MGFFELFIIAAGLSMDAFAVAVTAGLTMRRPTVEKALVIGLYFGVFQALMPLAGFAAGAQFADRITAYDHWIAFALLCCVGGKLAAEGLKKVGCPDRACPSGVCRDRACPGGERPAEKEISLKPARMLPLALATSIDAWAVGVSFAFLQVRIFQAVSFIGVTTLVLSMTGVKIGALCGERCKSRAALAGGAILILMGLKILLEHTGVIR